MLEPVHPFSAEALRAFGELVALRDAGTVDVRSFIAKHAAIADELTELDALSRRVDVLLGTCGTQPKLVDSELRALGLLAVDSDASARADLEHLEALRANAGRYERQGEVGRGGTSIVYRAHDRLLGRTVAMKLVRNDRGLLARFIAEARLVGRLEHPGVVPVHDVGLDAEGHAFFTMPLLRGRTLADVIRDMHAGVGNWNQTRALEVLLKVCDAVTYAHALGVVHRDLKPENVLVGDIGEVHVVDWGLAQVPGNVESIADVSATLDDPLATQHTRSGSVIGTPAYMSPEQAAGELELIGPKSDVYAIGAILYCLLAGHAPYCQGPARPTWREVLAAALAGPPLDVESAASTAPRELLAICRQAMQREPALRYPSVAAFAEDVRAYLDGRVVRAHSDGAWIQLRKWIGRNRALAAALALALFLLVAGSAAVTWSESRRSSTLERAARELRFESDSQAPAALRAQAQELWPAIPAMVPRLRTWLDDLHALLDRLPTYVAERDELRRRASALESDDARALATHRAIEESIHTVLFEIVGHEEDIRELERFAAGYGQREGLAYARSRIARLQARLARLEARQAVRSSWTFEDDADQARHDAIDRLVRDIEDLADPVDGSGAEIEHRLALARSIPDEVALESDRAWHDAIAEIADPVRSPVYGGLRLKPQVGLTPLRKDPHSGLYEFAHLASGVAPRIDAAGEYVIDGTTCIVLVLLPAGRFRMGKTAVDLLPTEFAIDGLHGPGPLRDVRLEAFFLSKFELTQGQWLHATGEMPSYFHAGSTFERNGTLVTYTLSHPVDSVDWHESTAMLARLGLELPTEAQLEYGYRGGTSGRWGIVGGAECILGGMNVMSLSGTGMLDMQSGFPPYDGEFHAMRVGTLPANAWGLHEVHGNVAEWARDVFWSVYIYPVSEGDGLHLAPESWLRVVRGGGWEQPTRNVSSWSREDLAPGERRRSQGLRPGRSIER